MPNGFSLFTPSTYPIYIHFIEQIFENVLYANPHFILRQTQVPPLYHLSS